MFTSLGISERSIDLVGFLTAAALLSLARWLLPPADRARVRLPSVYLVLALVFGLVTFALPASENIGRIFNFLYTFFLLASCGRSLVLLAVDVIFNRQTHRAPPRIFRDVTQAVVYVIVVLLTLRAVGVEPGSLLTTSALLTAVVGLALQDTLGNMVSGLALQMQRPFEVGDWVQFDADARQVGQVTEVNWRATTLMTSDLVEVIVPNALLAKAAIRNYSRPSSVSRRTVTVQAGYEASPEYVRDTITRALHGIAGVLADPPPSVQTRSFAESGIEYVVLFYVAEFAARDRIDGRVRDRIWYAMRRAGLEIPFPQRTVRSIVATDASKAEERERELARRDGVLRCVDFLEVLPADTHRMLAGDAVARLYAPGEVIVAQGDPASELFVVDRGEVVIELPREERSPREVARLGKGSFFGEMGVMTGEPRKATVRAATECAVLVLGHEAFHGALAKNPEVIDKIGELLLARQAELDAAENRRDTVIEPLADRSKRLISQIKSFFDLK
ncbi:MAG: Potassium efflux system KefA protein / Small-conductance mechanosensitive channel [Labilithrix sp.]|nr:Potassium efflux system KefA protein / Small-conductance mechanosensitive channel [Labilithrix sp.]